jgi:hypothetical protein
MKTKLTLAFMSVFMMVSSFAFASFPVERHVTTQTVTLENGSTAMESVTTLSTPAAVVMSTQTTAILLWFFLGFVAAHRWYLNSPIGWNILYILTFQGLGVWAIIDLIDLISENYPGL